MYKILSTNLQYSVVLFLYSYFNKTPSLIGKFNMSCW